MMIVSRLQTSIILCCLLSAAVTSLPAAHRGAPEEAGRCTSANPCPPSPTPGSSTALSNQVETISRSAIKQPLTSFLNDVNKLQLEFQQSETFPKQNSVQNKSNSPLKRRPKRREIFQPEVPSVLTRADSQSSTGKKKQTNKFGGNTGFQESSKNASEIKSDHFQKGASRIKRQQLGKNILRVLSKRSELTGSRIQPPETLRRRRELPASNWVLIPIPRNNRGFNKRTSSTLEEKYHVSARDTPGVWSKRPRYSPDDGGPKRNWRTNLMRVWGKRDGGFVIFEGIESFSRPDLEQFESDT